MSVVCDDPCFFFFFSSCGVCGLVFFFFFFCSTAWLVFRVAGVGAGAVVAGKPAAAVAATGIYLLLLLVLPASVAAGCRLKAKNCGRRVLLRSFVVCFFQGTEGAGRHVAAALVSASPPRPLLCAIRSPEPNREDLWTVWSMYVPVIYVSPLYLNSAPRAGMARCACDPVLVCFFLCVVSFFRAATVRCDTAMTA